MHLTLRFTAAWMGNTYAHRLDLIAYLLGWHLVVAKVALPTLRSK